MQPMLAKLHLDTPKAAHKIHWHAVAQDDSSFWEIEQYFQGRRQERPRHWGISCVFRATKKQVCLTFKILVEFISI